MRAGHGHQARRVAVNRDALGVWRSVQAGRHAVWFGRHPNASKVFAMDVMVRSRRPAENTRSRKRPLGRDAWLEAARVALVRHGISGVEIGKLARGLKVTRGGFYWFFESRQQLLDELLDAWRRETEAAFATIFQHPDGDGARRYRALREFWHGPAVDPQWDAAVREWARTSPRVAAVVRRVDAGRIERIRRIFQDLGAKPSE